jgi:hypothetical protein
MKNFRAKTVEQSRENIFPHNISGYDDHKLVCELSKKYSPNLIKVVEDNDDPWFLYVVTYKKNTGQIEDVSPIIRKDWPTHLKSLQNHGFILK